MLWLAIYQKIWNTLYIYFIVGLWFTPVVDWEPTYLGRMEWYVNIHTSHTHTHTSHIKNICSRSGDKKLQNNLRWDFDFKSKYKLLISAAWQLVKWINTVRFMFTVWNPMVGSSASSSRVCKSQLYLYTLLRPFLQQDPEIIMKR